MKQKLENIKIKTIKELFPNILYKKLILANVKTIKDFIDLPQSEYVKIKKVGRIAIKLFNESKLKIEEEPDFFYNYYITKTEYLLLPSNMNELYKTGFLDLLKIVVIEYLDLLKKEHHRDFILLGYGINSKKYLRKEIGSLYNYSDERVRQIQVNILSDFKKLLKGECIEVPKTKLKEEIVQYSGKISTRLYSFPVLSMESIIDCFKNEFQEVISSEKKNILALYMDIIGIIKFANYESVFTRAELFYTKKTIKNKFLKIAEKIKALLKKSAISHSETDLIARVRKSIKNADINLIKHALDLLPEIESFELMHELHYQLKFNYLGNAKNGAFRILSETGKVMSLTDILNATNHRLLDSGSSKVYNKYSFALAEDKRFVSLNNGYWGLKGWKDLPKDYYLKELIRMTLLKLNRPSSKREILSEILQIRREVKIRSFFTLIGLYCTPLENNLFILPEWKIRYKNKLRKK